jgi:hypothetical protein
MLVANIALAVLGVGALGAAILTLWFGYENWDHDCREVDGMYALGVAVASSVAVLCTGGLCFLLGRGRRRPGSPPTGGDELSVGSDRPD